MSQNPFADKSEPANPYASPVFTPDMSKIPPSGNAIWWQRLIHLFVDNFMVQFMSGGAGFVLGVVYASSKVAQNGTITAEDEFQLQLMGFALGLAISFGYFVTMEFFFQRTIAKFMTGTIVVSEDGGRPTFGQILGRTAARFIPFEAFSFIGSNEPRGWHDSLSGTRVMKVPK